MHDALQSKAQQFRRLHQGPRMLLLPNAWDAASARILEKSGAAALGTTSAGIAFSLGYRDGQRIPRAEMLAAIYRVARSVTIPVSADVEAGYGDSPEQVAETVRSLVEAGAAGLNLEDAAGDTALYDVPQQVERIRAARNAAAAAGVQLVINARTDVYLAGIGDPADRFEEALRRLTAYRDTGADCLFLPGVRDRHTIELMVQALRAPLNVLASEGMPPVRELENLGVARLSLGSGPMRAAMGMLRRVMRELDETGTYQTLLEGAVSYAEMNELMK